MRVFKFGGASVKDAAGIKNLAGIVGKEKGNLAIVVSAFGKITNALEGVLKEWRGNDRTWVSSLGKIHEYHTGIVLDLFDKHSQAADLYNFSYETLKLYLENNKPAEYDYEYDQIVTFGEIWSTTIVEAYLKESGFNTGWLDIRKLLITDRRFRDANILWDESAERICDAFDFSQHDIFVTQGFIAGTLSGETTTLGREGSDYSAAIIANILDAENVIVWKDVQGILNADPKWMPDAVKLTEVSYRDAVEMTFSGAKVIHPKTIKPLHNKSIPLYVRSFLDTTNEGTVIRQDITGLEPELPVYLKKENQILISILPKDFSFAMGDNLSRVFHSFLENGIKVNLVQASAISINVCVDHEHVKVNTLIDHLKREYRIIYNDNVEILTIRHYTPEAIGRIVDNREILIEQRTRKIVRFVLK